MQLWESIQGIHLGTTIKGDRRMPGIRFFVLFALFLSYAAAQYTSGVEGTATDESGSALANAQVVVTNQATQVTREITSNGAGYFLASDLAPGVYQVQVQMTGFKTWLQTEIQVDANRLRT